MTTSTGAYSIPNLQFAGFSISATAQNYLTESRGVILTAGVTTSVVNFQLASTASATRTISGKWLGGWGSYFFVMDLTQTGTVVTGTYEDQDGPGRTDPAEPGSFMDPNLVIRIKQGSFGDFTFRGRMDSTGTEVTGTVSGSGVNGTAQFFMAK